MPKYKSGERAENFEALLPDSTVFRLDDLKGHYVLLDFWGSWCPPCRKDNKKLVELYKTHGNKTYNKSSRLEIVSVGLETNKDNWQRAILADGLQWKYHIVELERLKGPIATKYRVREIPTKYLIDPSGHIIMVNPEVEKIVKYLDEIR